MILKILFFIIFGLYIEQSVSTLMEEPERGSSPVFLQGGQEHAQWVIDCWKEMLEVCPSLTQSLLVESEQQGARNPEQPFLDR